MEPTDMHCIPTYIQPEDTKPFSRESDNPEMVALAEAEGKEAEMEMTAMMEEAEMQAAIDELDAQVALAEGSGAFDDEDSMLSRVYLEDEGHLQTAELILTKKSVLVVEIQTDVEMVWEDNGYSVLRLSREDLETMLDMFNAVEGEIEEVRE